MSHTHNKHGTLLLSIKPCGDTFIIKEDQDSEIEETEEMDGSTGTAEGPRPNLPTLVLYKLRCSPQVKLSLETSNSSSYADVSHLLPTVSPMFFLI